MCSCRGEVSRALVAANYVSSEGRSHNLMLIGKNKRKMGKKALCLIFAFLLSINSFASIVSDNDGSAFITKAEYDSLKNNFQAQIDSYNTGIDNKIDNAIASYISGITVQKTVTESIINSKWEEISAMNGTFNNTFKVPSLDLQFYLNSLVQNNTSSDARSSQLFWYIMMHFAKLSYTETWGTTKNCYRNLVTCTGTEASPGNLIWAGRALRYSESWNISRMWRLHSTGNGGVYWNWLDRPNDCNFSVTMSNLSTIKNGNYVSSWDSVKITLWPMEYTWNYTAKSSAGATGTVVNSLANGTVVDNFRTTIELKNDESGKSIDHEHIINYDGDVTWRVSNAAFTNWLVAPDETTITSSTVKSTATLTQRARVTGVAHHTSTDTALWQGHQQDIGTTQNVTDNAKFPCIGMLSNLYAGSSIYQDKETRDIKVNKYTYRKTPPTLSDGFQFIIAKKDDVIEWEPQFNYVYAKNSTSTWVENDHEIDIYFSYGPFSNKCDTINKIQVQTGTDLTKKDYATTSSRSCKVKFTMPEDGMVYVKWVPHFTTTSYIDDYWLATLDISKCNTYKYTSENE